MELTTGVGAIVIHTIRYVQGHEPPIQVGESVISGFTTKMPQAYLKEVYRITKAS